LASSATVVGTTNANGVNETHAGTIASTSVASSIPLKLCGNIGNSNSPTDDCWQIQNVLGSVVSQPTSTLAFTHPAGTTGVKILSLAFPTSLASTQGSATATFAAGAGAGTSPGTPTCAASHVCDSLGGTVAMTTGTSPPTTGVALTVTTGVTRVNQPTCMIQIRLTASPYTLVDSAPTYTTTTIVFNLTGAALTASTAYTFAYSGCDGN